MTKDCHFKWVISEHLRIRLYLGLNLHPLCSSVCYPLGHSRILLRKSERGIRGHEEKGVHNYRVGEEVVSRLSHWSL